MPHGPLNTALPRCPECGETFRADDPRRKYCTPEHKRAWENRQLVRGQGLVVLAQAWRQGRHRKGSVAAKWALNEFCLTLDRYSAEDTAAGRMRALDVLETRLRAQRLLGL